MDVVGEGNDILGRRSWSDALELGYRVAAIDAREVTDGFKPGCPAGFFVWPACTLTATQAGYVLQGAYVRWSLGNYLTLRVAAENPANKSYLLTGFGGGAGTLAPGRDVRLNLEFRY